MICRLCLTETEFYLPLKNAENREKGEETEDIAEIIRKHFDLSLDINSDFVCTVCWQQISEFHTFYLFIEEKQKELSQQSSLPALTGTRDDVADNEHEVVVEEVAAQDGNGMDIKNECSMYLNAPMVIENSFSQGSEEATLQEATENLDIKNEFIDEVDNEFSNYESSSTATKNGSENESETDMNDEDDDEVDIKNESLIEISSPMITENSLSQWNQKATPQTVTKNLKDIRNAQLIDQVENEPVSCETYTNGTQQTKIITPEEKKQDSDKKIRRKKSDLIIAKHAGILKCELCAQTLKTFGKLRHHFKKKHGRNGYVRCCNKRYYLHYNYAEHLEWHSNTNLWKCEPCNLVYSCRDSYDSHLLQVHPEGESSKLKCTLCPARFSKGYLLLRHIKNQHSEKTFKCDECNKEFTTFRDLKVHKKRIHQRAYLTECDICGKSFANSYNCRIHKETIHNVVDNLIFQCVYCLQKFASRTLLKKHKNDCRNKQKCKCNECNKEFKDKYKLKQHIKTTHQRFYEIECDICCKMCANRSKLNIHKARVHGMEENLNLQCPLCPKKLDSKCRLNAHIEGSHSENKPKCDECGKGFKSSAILKRHTTRVHLRAYEIECDICSKTFASRTYLKYHKARVHAVEENLKFQCSCCPKKFALKSLLDAHRIYSHSNQKFKCDECDKEYKSLFRLKHHKKLSHLRAYETKCNICGKVFESSTRCNVHKATAHGLEECLNFQCPCCPKKFALRSLLNAHKRCSHSNQKFKCDECGKEFKNLGTLGQHQKRYHKIVATSTRFKIQKADRKRGTE